MCHVRTVDRDIVKCNGSIEFHWHNFGSIFILWNVALLYILWERLCRNWIVGNGIGIEWRYTWFLRLPLVCCFSLPPLSFYTYIRHNTHFETFYFTIYTTTYVSFMSVSRSNFYFCFHLSAMRNVSIHVPPITNVTVAWYIAMLKRTNIGIGIQLFLKWSENGQMAKYLHTTEISSYKLLLFDACLLSHIYHSVGPRSARATCRQKMLMFNEILCS